MLLADYVIFSSAFVNSLVLKGLAPELRRLTSKGQILRSASVIAFVTVISRICGYLRDQRVALLLGTSPAADSFVLAFRIPSLIRRMTGEGSLGASFIPGVHGLSAQQQPRAEAWAFAQKVFWDLARRAGGRGGCLGRLFAPSDLAYSHFWAPTSAVGPGHVPESNHFSGGFLHRSCGGGGGDPEQLSCLSGCRRRRRSFSIWRSSCFRSASSTGRCCAGSPEAFRDSGRRLGRRHFDRRRFPIGDADPGAGSPRDEFRARSFRSPIPACAKWRG